MVWGIHDAALHKDMAAASGKYFPDFTLKYVTSAGHWVQQEDPEEVNKQIRDFLKSKQSASKYLSNL